MPEKKIREEKPVCPSTKASNITLRRLAIRVKILQNQARIRYNQARILALRVRTRIKLMGKVLRLVPEVTYISRKPMIHPKLLRDLARELGENPDKFVHRCWMETTTVQDEIGSFEQHAERLGYVATTRCTLEVRVDYDPPHDEAKRLAEMRVERKERKARREAAAAQREAEREGDR